MAQHTNALPASRSQPLRRFSRAARGQGALLWLVTSFVGLPAGVSAAPFIVAGDVVVLELIASDPVALRDVDMLAFDAFGNLIGNRETFGGSGGVSYIDIDAGTASILISGISRADGLTLHPSGAMYVTSELFGASTVNRVYRVDITYDGSNIPIGAIATSITTTIPINNPEGIVALTANSAFGSTGDLYVCEDATPGRVFHLVLSGGNTAVASILVGTSANLRRPEGLTIGDFGGLLPAPMLYTGETTDDNVLQIGSLGSVSVLGNPAPVAMDQPDNVKFGHDGMLYVSEDIGPSTGRIIRIAVDGTHEVVLGGFNFPQGMAFDFAWSDLYIAEQGAARVWRARFDVATGDVDADGDVDLFDAAGFQQCFGANPPPQECLDFDFDRNDAIDLQDYDVFATLLVGP